MERNWIKIYHRMSDPHNQVIEEGHWPACFPFKPDSCLDGVKIIRPVTRPFDSFAVCSCGRHLYWRSVEDVDLTIPTEIIDVYGKIDGEITELDQYSAVDEIIDEEMTKLISLIDKIQKLNDELE